MRKITTTFTKTRSSGLVLEYEFKTYHKYMFRKDCPLAKHMQYVFEHGFPDKPNSCSTCSEVFCEVKKISHISVLHALKAEYRGHGKNQHPIIQDYFMENDPNFICMELPVWNEDRSGMIDILRFNDKGQIEILDAKPHAHKETKAASQLIYYLTMLMWHTGWPKEKFRMIYFDDTNAYEVFI